VSVDKLELILASASPRRTELLAGVGIPHRVVVAVVTEHEDPLTNPREMVLHNAQLKAAAVANLHPEALVLGADTTVAIDQRALNKPANLQEAREMLKLLSGREHTVHTGICLIHKNAQFQESHCITAKVRFRNLSDEAIERYMGLVNTLDKAGAYGIQEGREIIIESFEPPISTIMGLPVEFLKGRLSQLGLLSRLLR
jgi:septum formation protein